MRPVKVTYDTSSATQALPDAEVSFLVAAHNFRRH